LKKQLVSPNRVGIRNTSDYSPFGVELDGRTVSVEGYRFGYQGSEKDNEFKDEGNSYTTEFRQLDPRLGRWLSMDPVIQPWQSTYCSMDDSPILTTDIKGDKGESTHIDEKGNVIAVYNDGDNSIYQHGKNADGGTPTNYMITKRHEKWGTAAHGKKVGETKFWDEFLVPNKDGSTSTQIYPDTRIILGSEWDPLIESKNNYATNHWNLYETMEKSKIGQPLDIKNNKNYAPDAFGGPMTGRLLNGYYSTARSAGNYLAGMNGVTVTLMGAHISGTTYMKLAGAYQLGKLTNESIMGIVLFGNHYGTAPYYGEMTYSGRRILEGIAAGKKKL
jgi:RHS repeat-associated protein